MNRLWPKVFEVSVENNCAFSISSWTNFSGVNSFFCSQLGAEERLEQERGVHILGQLRGRLQQEVRRRPRRVHAGQDGGDEEGTIHK